MLEFLGTFTINFKFSTAARICDWYAESSDTIGLIVISAIWWLDLEMISNLAFGQPNVWAKFFQSSKKYSEALTERFWMVQKWRGLVSSLQTDRNVIKWIPAFFSFSSEERRRIKGNRRKRPAQKKNIQFSKIWKRIQFAHFKLQIACFPSLNLGLALNDSRSGQRGAVQMHEQFVQPPKSRWMPWMRIVCYQRDHQDGQPLGSAPPNRPPYAIRLGSMSGDHLRFRPSEVLLLNKSHKFHKSPHCRVHNRSAFRNPRALVSTAKRKRKWPIELDVNTLCHTLGNRFKIDDIGGNDDTPVRPYAFTECEAIV